MIGNKHHFVIAGASGLIGSSLLEMMLENDAVAKVTCLVRSQMDREHSKLVQKEINFDQISEKDLPKNADATFCCLGTTMRKVKGDKDAYRKVDYEYVVKLAVFSQRAGIPQYHVVSASGANASSRIFYNQLKGRMEGELQKLNKLRSIYIYRPSMLLGDRNEIRYAEMAGKFIMKAFSFLIPKSNKAIHDAQVAYSMLHNALSPKKGTHIISNKEMIEKSN